MLKTLWFTVLVLVTSWDLISKNAMSFLVLHQFPGFLGGFVLFYLKGCRGGCGDSNVILEMCTGEVDGPVKRELHKRCSLIIPLLVA